MFSTFLAVSFVDILWGLLSVVVMFVGLLLIAIILVQESKDGGLGGAFGGGGSNVFGAGMQRGLAKITAILAIVFTVCVYAMGAMENMGRSRSAAESDEDTTAVESGAAPGASEADKPAIDPGSAFPGGAEPAIPTDVAPANPTDSDPGAPADSAASPTIADPTDTSGDGDAAPAPTTEPAPETSSTPAPAAPGEADPPSDGAAGSTPPSPNESN